MTPRHAMVRTIPTWVIWTAIVAAAAVMLWALTLLRHAGDQDCAVSVGRTGARWTGADPRNITPWPPDCTLHWTPEGDH